MSLIDVAAHAKVSHITVSRALHRADSVSPATRARVIAALTELGYQPNSAARALVTGRSRTIGVVSFNTALYGPAAAIQGLERAAADAGYFLSMSGLEQLDAASLKRSVDRLQQQSVAAIAVISPQRELDRSLAAIKPDVPIVTLWGQSQTSLPFVASDEAAGAKLATEHLLRLGHETVWHLSGPGDRHGSEARIAGWRAALAEAGAAEMPLCAGDWSAASGYRSARELLRDPTITALFVASDQMALGVLRAAAELGRQVPTDLSIVGFDDIPESAYYTPPLTTVRQDFAALGRAALAVLLELLEDGEDTPLSRVQPVELILRASTTKKL